MISVWERERDQGREPRKRKEEKKKEEDTLTISIFVHFTYPFLHPLYSSLHSFLGLGFFMKVVEDVEYFDFDIRINQNSLEMTPISLPEILLEYVVSISRQLSASL